MQERFPLRSQYTDGAEGSSTAPQSAIERLPVELQMVGRYLQMQIREAQEIITARQQHMTVVESDPEYALLDFETLAKLNRWSKKRTEAARKSLLDMATLQGDIDVYSAHMQTAQDLLLDLQKGKYEQCVLFLKNQAETWEKLVQGRGKDLITDPTTRETLIARLNAARGYISLLEKKMEK